MDANSRQHSNSPQEGAMDKCENWFKCGDKTKFHFVLASRFLHYLH